MTVNNITLKFYLAAWLLVVSFFLRSQSLENIKAHYMCSVKGHEMDAESLAASIQLNLNDGDIIFRDNIGAMIALKTAADTLPDNLKNVRMLYEGSIQENINDFLEGDIKPDLMHVSGTLLINGVSRPALATCIPLRYNRASNELYMNFNMSFNPADFNLKPPAFPFPGLLEVVVKDGFVSKIE